MNEFQFLNYKDVNDRLEALVNNKSNVIPVKEEYPLGFTDYNLPIKHYTMGSGPKHIIVTGSFHAAEIITTTFVVRLMEDLASSKSFPAEEYTIDFIPIMNPEGYLITTEMQSLYLDKGKTPEEKIALAKDYWRINREDAINTAKANRVLRSTEASEEEKEDALKVLRGKKGYQALYDDIDKEAFLKDYPDLKESVFKILEANNYDIGVCASWTANAHGIDLSQNVPFNTNIEDYKKGPSYSANAYANLRKDTPGPLNCPCRDLNNFTFEVENLHLLNFLCNLNAKKGVEISAFLNYHSIMGKMYQRPVKEGSIINLYNIDYLSKITENYIGARIMRSSNAYDIVEGEDPFNYINEYLRLRFGINIQPELSRMGGNPIGPLADPDTFEKVTIKPNLQAFKEFVNNLGFIKEYSTFINYLISIMNENLKSKGEEPLSVEASYHLINEICMHNPTLYTKLKNELNTPGASSHIISWLFNKVAESIKSKEKEAAPVIASVTKEETPIDNFTKSYSKFLMNLIAKLNETRLKRNQDMLDIASIEALINNICLDYPEIYARLKYELNSDTCSDELVNILYTKLEEVLNNQIKMGNLIK